MIEDIKKYPVYYNNKEYEIKIEEEKLFMNDGYIYDIYINIYEVITYEGYLLGIYPLAKTKKKYKKVYSIELDNFKNKIYNDDNYYVELFKLAFKQYIDPIKTKEKQLLALDKWDGVINE